jgi:hypothetical protein
MSPRNQRSSYQWDDARGQSWGQSLLLAPRDITGGVSSDVPFVDLATWQGLDRADPTPVVLQVLAPWGAGGPQIDVGLSRPLYSSPENWVDYPDGQGQLRVDYSTRGVQCTRWIDIAEGSYQLPPCQYVSVAARTYYVPEMSSAARTIGASLAPGVVADPRVPTYTGFVAYDGEAALITWLHAPGAYGLRVPTLATPGSDRVVDVIGSQPEVRVGPYPDYYPPVADLVAVGPSCQIQISGDDAGFVGVQNLIGW